MKATRCATAPCYGCRECVLAPEVARLLARSAAIRRDPFKYLPTFTARPGHEAFTKDWLKPEPRLSLTSAVKRLAWTRATVWDGDPYDPKTPTYPDCEAWLLARRAAIGLP